MSIHTHRVRSARRHALTACAAGTIVAAIALVLPGALADAHPGGAQAAPARTLLAVFAHPDDETMAGPMLARYGREPGVTVHLVIATSGDKGVTPFAKIPAGDALAAVRTKEAACAASALGTRPPVMLGLPDGGLADTVLLAQLAAKLGDLIRTLKPDAIVTWGPDGGYGHPDHRLVSAVVTQVVQEGGVTERLFYTALPASGLNAASLKGVKFPAPFRATADERLTLRVAYTPDDMAKARTALACHASQFTPEAAAQLAGLSDAINRGTQYFRAWNGGPLRTDVFKD
jgi:LmbE family N-acetylglucosaminyl deacetylase